tara:strand:- start:14980 stop:15741 length:762 start_codon:yes stop_codon:yes gene_type:complete
MLKGLRTFQFNDGAFAEGELLMLLGRMLGLRIVLVTVLVLVPIQAGAQSSVVDTLPPTLPLFPLQDVMLFPRVTRPLHIFEPRYRELVIDALDGDRLIGIVLLRPGYEADYEGNPPIFSVGCVGEIVDAEELPDGRWIIRLRGMGKFRVLKEDYSRLYRLADVEHVPERLSKDDLVALTSRRQLLVEAFKSVVPSSQGPPSDLSDGDMVNGLAQYLVMDPLDRQNLLEATGPADRAAALLELFDSGRARPPGR